MEAVMKKAVLSLFLTALGVWLLLFSWQQREAALETFQPTLEAAARLKALPDVQNRVAFQQWFENRPKAAMRLFKQALSGNFLLVDAWLKLGEIEAARGNKEQAIAILRFTKHLSPGVLRWQWQQAMLALELNLRDLFHRFINVLIASPRYRQNALFVLDQEYQGNAERVTDVLVAENLPVYLAWLMQGRRVEDTLVVWDKMTAFQKKDPKMHLRYVDFLLHNHRVARAKAAWGKSGLTHPGFEKEITHGGFDWRFYNPKDQRWHFKRTFNSDPNRLYVAQITFFGKKNIDFHHLYQIFPVEPGASYTLAFEWRSQGLSTDQRPFMEVFGYDCKGLYAKSGMVPKDTDWQTVEIAFTVPAGCEAAQVRLRRLPSKRFDSKIEGRLWLDNFHLNKLGSGLHS